MFNGCFEMVIVVGFECDYYWNGCMNLVEGDVCYIL